MATELRQSNQNIQNSLNNEQTSAAPPEGIVDKQSPENSEYDSVESYSEDEEQEPRPQLIKARSRASDLDSHSENEGCGLEREEGDGQESVPAKKVDDDEDKKNPQYIPKRGTFYEHDDRTADTEETIDPVEAEKIDKDGKKKIWQDKKEKWSHDKFNDNEQAPKSRAELVAIYGYDIRNEDGPPRARRRRRYGRGPNKYTRNWEDEDAYNKPPPPINNRLSTKKPIRPNETESTEEFPPLIKNHSRSPDKYENKRFNSDKNELGKSSERYISNKENKSEQTPPPKQPNHNTNPSIQLRDQQEPPINKFNNQRVGTGRTSKPKKEIKDSDYRGFTTKSRIQRNMRSDEQKVLPASRSFKKEQFVQSQNFTNNKNSVQELETNMSDLNVQDGVYKGGNHKTHTNNTQTRQGSVPPRLQQSEQKGSKRYSSMRQRSLPETATPPATNFSFYPNDYNSQAPPPATQQPIMHTSPPLHPTPTQLPPPPLPPMAQQVAVTAAPILQAQFPPPFPQPPPAFLQPGVAPAAFIPSQTPQIINYVQTQPTFTPAFQGYQQQFNPVIPVTQPTELYQPQGGITYYSADQQQLIQRPTQKRPKAAIPIVAPTDLMDREQMSNENFYVHHQEDCGEGNIQYEVEQQD